MSDVAQAYVDLLRKSSDLPDHVRQGLLGAGADAVDALLALLADHSVDAPGHPSGGKARVHASVLLGHIGDRRAIEPLLEALVTDRAVPLQVRAHASALALIGDVAEPTLARVANATTEAAKLVLAMVLASCGEKRPEITEFLRELLPTEPMLVLPLVGRYGDPDLATDVGKVLLSGGLDGNLTALAVRTLGELGIAHPKLDTLSDKASSKAFGDDMSRLVTEAEKLLSEVMN